MKYDIETLHAKAADLERAAVEARRREEELMSALNSLENLSIAIFSLPDEILEIIFECFVEGDTGSHTTSRNAGPWVIGQICRRWRQLAHSTPSLWNMIRIDTHALPREPMKILKVWLERSQGLPLSGLLFLNQSSSATGIDDDIFQLVMENSHRWRYLEMKLGSRYDLYSRIASTEDLRFPLLQSLRILVNVPGAVNERPPPAPPLLSVTPLMAPSLTGASLVVLVPSALESILALPWSQLTELSMSLATSTRLKEIMASLKRLERCSLQISSQFVIAAQVVNLTPSLRRLELSGPLPNIINALSCLTSTGLVELGLRPPGGSAVLPLVAQRLLESMAQLQTRSSCQLRRLYIPITLFSSPESPRIAEPLSTVQALHLRLEGTTGSREAMRILKTSDVFRNLKELHLIVHKDGIGQAFVASLPDFVDMVASRRLLPSGRRSFRTTQLQCLEIDTIKYSGRSKPPLPVSREMAERLLRLKSDGMIFLGRVADGEWQPQHSATTHWDLEVDQRRWARFGYCDWLFD
ncbi:hypothetical protein AAF712_008906 [Marasmius tenuissimus]|uniref:F-box domain-containing protein n=1 Tax=Marasmius tenuissimus TaxID=585030 RepID=A0ABR2ZT06_9AGAR